MNERNYVLNGVPSDEFHVTYVDKLQAENAKLKAERDTAIKEMVEQSKQHGYAQAEIDRLRKALEEILKVYSPSPVKTYQTMEDIAKQALKQEKQNDY